ncbi:hypothetical protein [Leptospira alexanderi]|uniref:hypothetical protein n=1 Tax=Leptospira alexanderi TaxID=100053 RepID=UPI0009913425|nr:hypothetical protein [Leptospira alexanderi]
MEHPDKSLPFLKMGAFLFALQADIKNSNKSKSASFYPSKEGIESNIILGDVKLSSNHFFVQSAH